MIYHFKGHRLDCERRELRRGGELVAVEPQVFDLLRFLIEQRARVVSRDDLLGSVWRGRIVSDSTVGSRINAARKVLGDTGREQALIRTIARKGIRFVAEVREQADDEPVAGAQAPAAVSAAPVAPSRRSPVTVVLGLLAETWATALTDPDDLRDAAAVHLGRARDTLRRHGGFCADASGDALIALFGYPRAQENDAECAVRAALESIDASSGVGGRNAVSPLRIGIATGLVIAEDAGVGPGVIVGAALNLARGLATRAADGTIVACAATRRLIGELFEVRDFGTEGAAQVIREGALADRYAALRPRRWPLVGRDEELALLLRRWQQVRHGAGRIVVVCGEPGIGKSRLVAALDDAIRSEPHTNLAFFGSPHRGESPLHPVIAQFERAAGFEPHDDHATRLDRLERLLASSGETDASDVALFAELLAIPASGSYRPLGLSPRRRKEKLFESLVALIAASSVPHPLMLLVEDAHWFDPTTLEWLDLLVEHLPRLHLLLIVTCRPEFRAPWIGQAEVTALTLSRLTRTDNAALVRHVTAGAGLAPEMLDLIATRSDGVPLFIEELAASAIETLGATQSGSPVETSVAVPLTLKASLAARLDRLGDARDVVQLCAALGRQFDYRMLRSVANLPAEDLVRLLQTIVAAGLLRQRGAPPDALYTFKHALLQDAAYETLLRQQRIAIERSIVAALERDRADFGARQPEVLAHHCEAADLPERAIDFRIHAARLALDRSAGVESQAQVERAQRLLPRVDETHRARYEGRLGVALGNALLMTRGFAAPEVKAALSRARELLDPMRDPVESLSALCSLSNYHLIRSESAQCLALVEPLASREHEPPVATVLEYLTGTAHLHLGNFAASVRHLETALAAYDEEAFRPLSLVAGLHLHSFALIWLSLARLYLGRVEHASETMHAAVADARSRSHPFTLVSALLAQARFRHHVGDMAGAVAATEEGMAIACEQRSPYHISRAAVLRAVNLIESGSSTEGVGALAAALVEHRATGANFLSSFNLSCLARGHAGAGDVAAALDFADQALSEIERSGERWWQAEALRIKGEILLQAAQPEEAFRHFAHAESCAQRQGARFWELRAARSLAGDPDRAT